MQLPESPPKPPSVYKQEEGCAPARGLHSNDSGTLLLHEPPPQGVSDAFRELPASDTFRELPPSYTFRELPDPAHPSGGYGGHPALADGFDGSGGGFGGSSGPGGAAAAEPTDYEAALASAMAEASG